VHAVITAGGTVDGELAAAMRTRVKALASLRERTLIDVALAACDGAGIDDVLVVGGAEVRAHLSGRSNVRIVEADADGRVNVLRALDGWPGDRFVYLSSDLPFVSADGLRTFVTRSAEFAVTMALADVTAYVRRFPGAPAHAVSLRGERFVNGSAFVIGPEAVAPARELATKLFAARKNLARLALLLGPALCVRFAARRLGLSDLERYGTRRLGVRVAAIRGCDPGLCYDVDTLDDYAYARAHAGGA